MKKPVLVSGFQPTGNFHIGNFLGAVKNCVALQNSEKYDCYFFIADYHSLTGNMSADERRDKIVTLAIELLALGIDPKKSTLFVQSSVPEHTELSWIFETVTPIAELERMTQYKDKAEFQKKNINTGLLTYPVLQVADVLLYRGTVVPVGQDQVQHVELIRDAARWFNKKYTEYFDEAKVLLTDTPKIMSLKFPDKKMSKSHGHETVIELADEPSELLKKIKRAPTATEGGSGALGARNLLDLYKHFGEPAQYKMFVAAEKSGSIQYGELKTALAAAIADSFADFRARRNALEKDREQVAAFLTIGAKKAQKVAQKTMEEVRKLVGIR